MFDWLGNLFKGEREQAEARLQAQPIVINAPEHIALQRALGRLLNLYSVKNPSEEILATIEGYKQAVASFGHTPPNDYDETEQLIRSTRE